ncbi:LPS responsive beige-like anchor protein, partial [Homo sapiens]
GFTEIEAEKSMSSGGILRQCLRLVCAVAVRNCLECQQHSQLKTRGDKALKPMHSLIPLGKSAAKSPVDIVTGGISPVRDLDRLLQDMDINRLRAVVFRDITKKSLHMNLQNIIDFVRSRITNMSKNCIKWICSN